MHFFLTGNIQVGKSMALREALRVLGMPVCGFETFFPAERGREDSRLLMRRAGAPRVDDDASVVARFEGGRMVGLPERFDAIGCALLAEADRGGRLILMDECGRLEAGALRFQQAVLRALDGGTPVLGVVRQGAGGWTEKIIRHPRVQVVTVTEENRDGMPERIVRHVAKGLYNQAGQYRHK